MVIDPMIGCFFHFPGCLLPLYYLFLTPSSLKVDITCELRTSVWCLGIGLFFFLGIGICSAENDVRIWDNGATTWTTTFADGDPIDTGTANNAFLPEMAIDSNDIVYVTYYQSNGAGFYVYLSRYYAIIAALLSGQCFIAPAAYGSRMAEEVSILKSFRDTILLKNAFGRALVKTYYRFSPPIAHYISKKNWLRGCIRVGLLPFIGLSLVTLKIGVAPTIGLLLLLIGGCVCFIKYGLVLRTYPTWFGKR